MKKLQAYKWFVLLIVVALLPLNNLITTGFPEGHDTQDHVARIANFYQNLAQGTIVPRWAGNLNWGYGHPILMFLYPLTSYVASLFILTGFSIVDATKLVFALGFIGSGITMYLWIREIWGESAGVVSGILYMYAPYRFVDLYVRGAIGENFFFIFPPLVCFFLLKLSKQYKWPYIVGGSVSLAGMILSHNALTLMFLPFIVVYSLIVLYKSNKTDKMYKKIQSTLGLSLSVVFGFGISAFFWMPAFFEGKYTLRDIVTGNEILQRFETFERLLYSPWDFGGSGVFSVQVGIAHWIMIVIAPIFVYVLFQKIKSLKDHEFRSIRTTHLHFLILVWVFFWIAVFFTLDISRPVYEKTTILQKFQFPWRWLSLAIFPPAIIAGYVVYILPKKFKLLFVGICLLLVLVTTKNMWYAKAYVQKPESFFTSVYYGTTDTGESAPIWSVRFMEKLPVSYAEVIEGEGTIEIINRSIRTREYEMNIFSDKARILENTLYFPGWFIVVDKKKLSTDEMSFQDPAYRGLMTYYVPTGRHTVTIQLEETKLRKVANGITLVSIGMLSIIPLLQKIAIRHKS